MFEQYSAILALCVPCLRSRFSLCSVTDSPGWIRISLLVALLMVSVACQDSSRHAAPSRTTVEPSGLRFVKTDAAVRAGCERDSRALGWAVPCPTVLPGVTHVDWCTESRSCIYTGGEPPIPMFYLSVDFPGPAPLGEATVRHLVIEAFPKHSDRVLDPPCANPEPLPALPTRIGVLASFRCLEHTGAQEARILHGEAIHTHHDLVRWTRRGIVYVVSVHRSGLDTRQILRTVAENVVPPI